MSYEFQSTLHRTLRSMLDAIAEEWVTCGGLNGPAMVNEVFAENTDEALAAECVSGWGLDQAGDDETPSHMTRNDYTLADLIAAFSAYRDEGHPNAKAAK
jgi:hypothetical protein